MSNSLQSYAHFCACTSACTHTCMGTCTHTCTHSHILMQTHSHTLKKLPLPCLTSPITHKTTFPLYWGKRMKPKNIFHKIPTICNTLFGLTVQKNRIDFTVQLGKKYSNVFITNSLNISGHLCLHSLDIMWYLIFVM